MDSGETSPDRRDVVVVGASAGGVEALRAMVAGLPADLPATIVVVLHVPSYGRSVLPDILRRSGPLPASHVTRRTEFEPGQILVAPPDRHVVIHDDHVIPTSGPRENGHRPAVDVLFRSAARALGPRVVAVELSGVLDDGAAGMWAVRSRGGLVVVQDPVDCLYGEMPQNVMATVEVDHVLPARDIGALLDRACREPLVGAPQLPPSDLLVAETDIAMMEEAVMDMAERPGEAAGFSCPDCGGTLFEVRDGGVARYRCRVGHAWTAQGLFGQQSDQVDDAIWIALRALEEKAALSEQLAERAGEQGSVLTAARFREHAAEIRQSAAQVRTLIESRPQMAAGAVNE